MQHEFLYQFSFWITVALMVVVLGAVQGACAYMTLLERKIAAWTQDRHGPNRVGPLGLLQPIVDGIKFVLKEQVIPANVDKLFYLMAPAIALATALLAFAVVPFGGANAAPTRPWPQNQAEEKALLAADPNFPQRLQEYNDSIPLVLAPHVDIGILYVFAIGSLAAYAIVLGGWSSNNKYSLLGGLRSSAQLISYEIPMGTSILGVILLTGSLNIESLIAYQYGNGWNFFFQPLAALLFITSIFAECNRVPFDLSECEQELVGGYHTEYSGMKFALFFLGEYTHLLTTSFLAVALFFGGYLLPGVTAPGYGGPVDVVLKLFVFLGKVFLFVLFYMLIRWTVPRFRFDQLMSLAWKVLLPLSFVNFACVLLVKHYEPLGSHSSWLMLPISVILFIASAWLTLKMPKEPGRSSHYRARQSMGHTVMLPEQSVPQ